MRQCRRSVVIARFTDSVLLSFVIASVSARLVRSPTLRLASFLLPSAGLTLAASHFSVDACAHQLSMWANSPLGHDMRQAARVKWQQREWLQQRLQPLEQTDAQMKGTGLPLLYTIPDQTASNSSRQESQREGYTDEQSQTSSDLPPMEEMEAEDRAPAAAPARRPLLSVSVNDRPLLTLPPGKTAAGTPDSPPSSTSSSSSPSSSAPITPWSMPSPTSSLPHPTASTPPIPRSTPFPPHPQPDRRRAVEGEDEDEFGLSDGEGGGRGVRRLPERPDAGERRQRREDRRRGEEERAGPRGAGERRRPVRRNEFGDEVFD